MIRLFDGSTPAGGSTTETVRAQEAARSGPGAAVRRGQRATGEDRVEFSAAAGSLRSVLEGAASSRAGRVEGLRATYQAGGYAADAAAISRGMVDEALSAGASG